VTAVAESFSRIRYDGVGDGRPDVTLHTPRWLRVPVGAQSSVWTTLPQVRTVLVVAHTVTSTTRLLEVLSLFDGDTRIQILFSEIPASAFDDGLLTFLHDIQAKIIPWEQATRTRFDLALCAGNSGPLHAINAPILVLPHGAGYNKYLSREPGAGSREPGAGSREPGAGSREPGGRPMASRGNSSFTRAG
jgi:hypothetical protein